MYEIRYTFDLDHDYKDGDYDEWCTKNVKLDEYLDIDKEDGCYGKNQHQFIPVDYVKEVKNERNKKCIIRFSLFSQNNM